MIDTDSPANPMQRAIDQAGSQSELARRIGVTQTSVRRWLNGTPIPGAMVLAIERETAVSRHDLNPETYPREDKPTPRSAPLAPRPPAFDGLEPAR